MKLKFNLATALMLLLMPALTWAQDSRLISGRITDGTNALPDVAIQVEGTDRGTVTNSEGRYEIQAVTNDVLVFSYAGMKTVSIRIEDVTRYLNFAMTPDFVELDEVTVQSRLKSQKVMELEYNTNPKIIKSSFGYINAELAPGRIKMIEGEDINFSNICILDFLKQRFSGIETNGSCPGGGNVYIRSMANGTLKNIPAVFDVDGMVMTDVPVWLDLNNIKRIAILYSRSMATRYGQLGQGGVIVINTKNDAVPYIAQEERDRPPVRSLSAAELAKNEPQYLQDLKASESPQAAKQVYQEYATRYAASSHFFLDAYRYFYEAQKDKSFADAILEENKFRFARNPVALKGLAYIYQSQGRFYMARDVLKEVFILRPSYSQSYYDMARAYHDAGDAAKAAGMYGRYQYLTQEGYLIGSDDFWLIQQHDSDNLFAKEGESLGADMRAVSTDDFVKNSTRILVEWNDSEAEFELQFVNPENRTHVWYHTREKNAQRIEDEQIAGYSVAEQIIDGSLPGLWQVNANYLGNKSLTPTYLKVTTFYNYGTPQETRQVRTFKLFLKNNNQHLFSLTIPGSTTSPN